MSLDYADSRKSLTVPEKGIANESSQPELHSGQANSPPQLVPTYPDGGREAWTVVAGAFLAIFISFGFLNAFGVFQAYYKTHQLADQSESNIAWIGAFQIFSMCFMGTVSGSLFDKFGPRTLITVGGVGFSVSCMLQSICTKYWQFFLAQGLLQGLCLSALYSPSLACISHWFSKRRGLALGVATSGSSIGGVLWPITIDHLITKVGFGWALRICGFICLALTAGAAIMIRSRLPPRTGSQFFALDLFRTPAYAFFCLGMFFIVLGLFFILFYLSSYGAIHGFSSNMIFYSVSILNAASLFGRILPGMAADTWGRYNIMIITTLLSAVLTLASIAAKNTSSILVVGALYGFTSGSVVTLQAACVPPLLDDPRKIGVGIGQMLSVSGIGALLGPPICGWLIGFNGFISAQIFAGVMMAVGAFCLVITRAYLAKGSQIV